MSHDRPASGRRKSLLHPWNGAECAEFPMFPTCLPATLVLSRRMRENIRISHSTGPREDRLWRTLTRTSAAGGIYIILRGGSLHFENAAEKYAAHCLWLFSQPFRTEAKSCCVLLVTRRVASWCTCSTSLVCRVAKKTMPKHVVRAAKENTAFGKSVGFGAQVFCLSRGLRHRR